MQNVEFLQIEPTTRCNFTCGFCCGRSMDQGDLSFEVFERALASLPHLRHIELQGEGEPFMHPRLFDMMALARARGVEVSMITNGSYFSDETIERLLPFGLNKILVSIESPDPAEFRQIRGGKLEKVLRGIRALIAARNRAGHDRPAIGLSVTVLKSTETRLSQIFSLYNELGLDGGIALQPLQTQPAYVACYTSELIAETYGKEDVTRVMEQVGANPAFTDIALSAAPVRGFYEELFATWDKSDGMCPWLESGAYVSKDGYVTGCCTIKGGGRFAFGRVGIDSVVDMEDRRNRLRADLAAGVVPAACTGCRVAEAIVEDRDQAGGPRRPASRVAAELPPGDPDLVSIRIER